MWAGEGREGNYSIIGHLLSLTAFCLTRHLTIPKTNQTKPKVTTLRGSIDTINSTQSWIVSTAQRNDHKLNLKYGFFLLLLCPVNHARPLRGEVCATKKKKKERKKRKEIQEEGWAWWNLTFNQSQHSGGRCRFLWVPGLYSETQKQQQKLKQGFAFCKLKRERFLLSVMVCATVLGLGRWREEDQLELSLTT